MVRENPSGQSIQDSQNSQNSTQTIIDDKVCFFFKKNLFFKKIKGNHDLAC